MSIRKILNYYFNRLVRILPIYYVIIGTIYVVTGGFFASPMNFLKNMLFIEANSHLWFLQQEMVMYLCMPFIFILVAGVKSIIRFKYNDLGCAVFLTVLAFIAYRYLTVDIFYLNGNGSHVELRLGQFLIGVALGYLYKAYRISKIDLSSSTVARVICDCIVAAFLAFAVLSSAQILGRINPDYQTFYIGWQMPMLCTTATAVLIAALLLSPSGLLARILGCKWSAYIGEISFGIYLIHMFLVPHFNFGSKIVNFIVLYLVSIVISTVLHIVVEKPSIVFAKSKSVKAVIEYYRSLV